MTHFTSTHCLLYSLSPLQVKDSDKESSKYLYALWSRVTVWFEAASLSVAQRSSNLTYFSGYNGCKSNTQSPTEGHTSTLLNRLSLIKKQNKKTSRFLNGLIEENQRTHIGYLHRLWAQKNRPWVQGLHLLLKRMNKGLRPNLPRSRPSLNKTGWWRHSTTSSRFNLWELPRERCLITCFNSLHPCVLSGRAYYNIIIRSALRWDNFNYTWADRCAFVFPFPPGRDSSKG